MKTLRFLGLALAMACAAVGMAQTARPVIVELLRPQSDDAGHYVAFAGPLSFPIMGVVASSAPATSVTVNNVPAAPFAVNYRPQGTQDGMVITGFRATVFLNGNSLLRVVATDEAGNVGDASYLPDDANTLQRLQFWQVTAPGNFFNSLRLANAHAWVTDMATALPLYERFLTQEPDFLVGRHLRALAQMDMGNPKAALADLNFVVNAAPEVWPPRMDLALALYQTGDLQGAADQYRLVLETQPDLAEAHLHLGQVLLDLGNLPDAALQQEEAVADEPAMADANYQLGQSQAQRGEYDRALYSMTKAVRLNPRSGDAYAALAQIRYQRGDYRRAWQMVDRARRWGAESDPGFVAALRDRMVRPHQPGESLD